MIVNRWDWQYTPLANIARDLVHDARKLHSRLYVCLRGNWVTAVDELEPGRESHLQFTIDQRTTELAALDLLKESRELDFMRREERRAAA